MVGKTFVLWFIECVQLQLFQIPYNTVGRAVKISNTYEYDCEGSENFFNERTLSNKEKVKFNRTELFKNRSVVSNALMVESYQRGIKIKTKIYQH